MQITSGMVKELREKTGAGLMDCKAALTASVGDMEAAIDHLRKKGLAAAAKKSSRIASEGVVCAHVEGNSGALVEVNCETDFVARTDDFVALAKEIAALVNAKAPRDVDEALLLPAGGGGHLGEKMVEAVRSREDMYPTTLENGVALLHPRRPMANILGQAFLALGVTPTGIPFGSERGILTDVFFLICSVDDRGHLRTLARLSRVITSPGLLAAIRQAPDAHAVRQLIVEAEASL